MIFPGLFQNNFNFPGSNASFATAAFSFSPRRPSPLSCINEHLAIDSRGNVSDLVFVRNCCVTRMLARKVKLVPENEQVCQGKKQPNGLDTALYKNNLFSTYLCSLALAACASVMPKRKPCPGGIPVGLRGICPVVRANSIAFIWASMYAGLVGDISGT